MGETKQTKGLRVGKYLLKETLGTGFFAEVKLAVHVDSGKKYAIKIIDKRKVPLKDLERQIKREVKIMQYLRHDFIVSVHQVLMSGTRMYLVMDYVSGGELFDLIVKKQRVDEKESRKYFQQLVDAVSYCHSKGVYHRDLKPENLLLDDNGNLKITDFGMSFLTENATDAADALLFTHCGTPEYMAPELACRSHKGYKGDKLDVWSCGVILFVLLAGGLPFSGKNDAEIFRQITKKKLLYPSWFSSDVCDLLDQLLIKEPEERIRLEDVKKHPWFVVDYEEHIPKSGRLKMPAPLDETEPELPPSEYLMNIMSPTGMMSPRQGPNPTVTPPNAAAVAEALQGAIKENKGLASPDSVMDSEESMEKKFPDTKKTVDEDAPSPSVRKLFMKKTNGDDAPASFRVRVPSFLSPRGAGNDMTSPKGIKSSGSRMGARGFSLKQKGVALDESTPNTSEDKKVLHEELQGFTKRKEVHQASISEELNISKKKAVHAELSNVVAQKDEEKEIALKDELSVTSSKKKIGKEMAKLFGRGRTVDSLRSLNNGAPMTVNDL
mmetsp:Transcript_27953/g.67943  ORF Transcript_27953/g.67943 Transcript_27953/m.67943 type:complete len:551 (+) Transcript_27953:147-1799(+)